MSENRTTRTTAGRRVTGVVLAGGGSRRMGRDKALLQVAGRPLLELAAEKLSAVCAEVLVADAGRAYPATGEAQVVSVPDGPGAGPAAGILGAAQARPDQPLLVLACDLPNMTGELLAHIAQEPGDWVVPDRGGQLEPLVALYRPAALAALARRVQAGRFALHTLAEEPDLRIRRLTDRELAAFGDPDHLFRNLNRPEDLA